MHISELGRGPSPWHTGAAWIGIAIAALGLLVLFGWIFEYAPLTTAFTGLSSMKPNTAIGLMLVGLALWRLAVTTSGRLLAVGQICAALAAVIAALTLLEYATGRDLGIDQLVMADPLTPASNYPGRMSVITALCFVLFGTAALTSHGHTRLPSLTFLTAATIGLLISFTATLGYLLSSQLLYHPFPSVSIALHTTTAFLLAFTGLAAVRPDLGVVAVLRSPGAGGRMARRLLPIVVILVPLTAWASLQGASAALVDIQTGVSLFTLLAVVLLGAVIWVSGYQANRLDAHLHASEQRYRQVVDEIQEAIWLDEDGRIVFANPYAAHLFGADSTGQLIGRDIHDMVHPNDRDLALDQVRALRSGGVVPATEMRLQHFDGSTIIALVHGIPLIENGKRPVLFTARDMTQQRETEEQLRQSQKLDSIGRLTGGIAHDFNNLLTIVIGNAELLIESQLNAAQQRLAAVIVKASLKGAELTKQMLAFSRRQPLQPKRIDGNALLAGLDSMLQRTLGEDVELTVLATDGLWPFLADPTQLETAILNMAINARHAMPDGGKLTIEMVNATLDEEYCERNLEVSPGEYVLLAVTDTGAGMPPHVLEKAFEPFFTTKGPGKGTGLGLSMVFGFAKQSRGHVSIYSEVGAGTTVKLYLPRYTGQYSDAATGDVRPDRHGGSETILLVEDDDDVRSPTATQLRALGYRVIEAGDGPSALEAIAKNQTTDLLFTDVILPRGMSGKQLADRVKELKPGIKILFASGYTENAIIHQGRLDPGVHLLSKPYRGGDLSTMVRKVLDRG